MNRLIGKFHRTRRFQQVSGDFSRWPWALLVVSLVGGSVAWASGTGGEVGYEPCHLLCTIESGRAEYRQSDSLLPESLLTFRLESVYVSPRGHYEVGRYQSIAEGASTTVLQFLPSVRFRPNEFLLFSAGLPLEYNRTSGVVLPTLRPTSATQSEIAPGGIFLSAQARVLNATETGLQAWSGLGYRLSSPIGTVDVSGSVKTNPDKALEALGVGSDDIYALASASCAPEQLEEWAFGAGGELRVHMLPKWQRWFATTIAYHSWAQYLFSDEWSGQVRLSGFYTGLRAMPVAQVNAAIFSLRGRYEVGPSLALEFAASSVVPGTALNRNSLQTLSFHTAVEARL